VTSAVTSRVSDDASFARLATAAALDQIRSDQTDGSSWTYRMNAPIILVSRPLQVSSQMAADQLAVSSLAD